MSVVAEIAKKVGNFEYKIESDQFSGMKVPVRIFANDDLLSKMLADRTIEQAINVAKLRGVQKMS